MTEPRSFRHHRRQTLRCGARHATVLLLAVYFSSVVGSVITWYARGNVFELLWINVRTTVLNELKKKKKKENDSIRTSITFVQNEQSDVLEPVEPDSNSLRFPIVVNGDIRRV